MCVLFIIYTAVTTVEQMNRVSRKESHHAAYTQKLLGHIVSILIVNFLIFHFSILIFNFLTFFLSLFNVFYFYSIFIHLYGIITPYTQYIHTAFGYIYKNYNNIVTQWIHGVKIQ
jgi:hypothetical protein